jgi:predicted nucleic acid-binding protein
VSKRRLVDTNLILRYLAQDHEKHVKAAGKLFDACDRGNLVLIVLPVVLAARVYVGVFLPRARTKGGLKNPARPLVVPEFFVKLRSATVSAAGV